MKNWLMSSPAFIKKNFSSSGNGSICTNLHNIQKEYMKNFYIQLWFWCEDPSWDQSRLLQLIQN